MKREIDLTPYVQPIMDLAEKTNIRDFLMLALIGEGAGFRRGEVVGTRDRRETWKVSQFEKAKKKSEIPHRQQILHALLDENEPWWTEPDAVYTLIRNRQYILKMRKDNPLPGLQVQDLHDGCIWVRGKGATERQQPIPKWLYEKLQSFIGKRKNGPIFDYSPDGLYKLTKKYAFLAEVPDWKLVHPHRFRHAYIRSVYRKTKDPVMTQALARHKDFNMTNHYIGEPDMVDKQKAVEGLFT